LDFLRLLEAFKGTSMAELGVLQGAAGFPLEVEVA